MPRGPDRAALSGLDARRAWAPSQRRTRCLRVMSHAPLPLLGIFHEASLAVDDVRGSLEFYERLGFSQAPTTATLTHRYGVLTDGRLFIGLHQRSGAPRALPFVRQGIASSRREFAPAGDSLR